MRIIQVQTQGVRFDGRDFLLVECGACGPVAVSQGFTPQEMATEHLVRVHGITNIEEQPA